MDDVSSQILAQVESDLGDRLAEAAEIVSRDVYEATPQDTGDLAKSTRYVIDRENLEIKIVQDEFYAAFLAFGTKHIAANDYFAQACEAALPKVLATLEGK